MQKFYKWTKYREQILTSKPKIFRANAKIYEQTPSFMGEHKLSWRNAIVLQENINVLWENAKFRMQYFSNKMQRFYEQCIASKCKVL